jgi:MFS family permease
VLVEVTGGLGLAVLGMSLASGAIFLFLALLLVRGLGQGALSVVSMALVGKWFTRRLGPAMGVFTVLLAVGFIAGTVGLGETVKAYGWRPAWAGLGWQLLFGLAPLG